MDLVQIPVESDKGVLDDVRRMRLMNAYPTTNGMHEIAIPIDHFVPRILVALSTSLEQPILPNLFLK